MTYNNYAARDKDRVQSPDHLTSNSAGMVLVVVVIMAAVAGILATGLHFASGSRITQVRQEMRFDKAFFVAEAGIERAKATLRTNRTTGVLFGGLTSYGEGRFQVNAQNSASGTNRFIIRSTGIVETATRAIEVEVQLTPFTPAQADGALGIYGTNTDLTVSGNGKIDGHDWNVPADFTATGHNADGTLSGNPTNPGVFYTSTSTVISVSGSGELNGNPPTTNGVGLYTETYWYQFLDRMLAVATLYTGGNLGTRTAPTVTMLPTGITTINNSDKVSGAGILIIPGDASLSIKGTFHFEGLVILVGNGVIDADSEFVDIGTARIFGAMICVGGALDLSATGSADIKYSTQALANLANLQVPAQINMISWKEIK